MGNAENWVQSLAAVSGLATLAIAIIAMFISLRQPAGRQEPGARIIIKIPMLISATILFFGAGVLLWRPLPIIIPEYLEIVLLVTGSLLFFCGLELYLWGLFSLGRMFAPSSGFAVRLHQDHKLVKKGPYALMRHPMYLAVILSANGSLLLFRTWSALVFAIIMFGLIIRARREEKVLAEEFGFEWENYASNVPKWFPSFFKSK
jgi:protein-S-isoprenylcysteine O-methyltransferase Ste14